MTAFMQETMALTLDDVQPRLHAAFEWISCAQGASGDGGISKGYHIIRRRWSSSYLETTGYIIPSLLNVALVLNRPGLPSLALVSADYLLRGATPEDAVVHWANGSLKPMVFDTARCYYEESNY